MKYCLSPRAEPEEFPEDSGNISSYTLTQVTIQSFSITSINQYFLVWTPWACNIFSYWLEGNIATVIFNIPFLGNREWLITNKLATLELTTGLTASQAIFELLQMLPSTVSGRLWISILSLSLATFPPCLAVKIYQEDDFLAPGFDPSQLEVVTEKYSPQLVHRWWVLAWRRCRGVLMKCSNTPSTG